MNQGAPKKPFTDRTWVKVVGGLGLVAVGAGSTAVHDWVTYADNKRDQAVHQALDQQAANRDQQRLTGDNTSRAEADLQTAIQDLHDKDIATRLLGVDRSTALVKGTPTLQRTLVPALSSLIRQQTPKPAHQPTHPTRFPDDVQRALDFLLARDPIKDDGATINLTGAYLPGAHLDGINLVKATLDGIDLTGAHLAKANLMGANLYSRANLSGADLTGATLTSINASATTRADGLRLTGATLTSADLSYAALDNASLNHANLAVDSPTTPINLAYSTLTGADLREADLAGVSFEDADLTAADLRGATITHETTITDARLVHTKFLSTDLTTVPVEGSDIDAADVTETTQTTEPLDCFLAPPGQPNPNCHETTTLVKRPHPKSGPLALWIAPGPNDPDP